MGILSKIKGKINYLLREVTFYGYFPKNNLNLISQEEFIYQEISQLTDIKDFSFENNFEDYKNRFNQKHVFCIWKNQEKVIAYGWLNPNSTHYLGELALDMDMKSKIEVLYDFYTYKEYRGKGLYPALLQKMCLRNNKSKLIYVFSSNKSSIRGIEKAGFEFLGNIKGYNKMKYQSLLKKLWEN